MLQDATLRGVVLAAALLWSAGCLPPANEAADEQRDPHFLMGQSRSNSKDYKGAIESFEKALETNPRSASAHFELGLLYEQQEANFAEAIHHYEKYLKLQPNGARSADIVKPHILICKQEIAKSVFVVPGVSALQRDMEKTRSALERALVENAQYRDEIARMRGLASARPAAATNPPLPVPGSLHPAVASLPLRPASPSPTSPGPGSGTTKASPAGTNTASAGSPAPGKVHTVRTGENPSSIARQYGIRTEALMAANPGVNAGKLRVGQTLRIPSR